MGMARMTDIDALLEKVAKIQASDGRQEKRVGEIILAITNAPTVEVVRCKECKHYVLHALACWHENFNGIIPMNGYCYYGERKDNGI